MRLSGCGAIPRCLVALLLLLPAGIQAESPEFFEQFALPSSVEGIGFPRAVVADLHTTEIFVCDTRVGRILVFGNDGFFNYEIPGGRVFSTPMDLAVDPDGYLLLIASRKGVRMLMELDFDGLFLRDLELAGLPEDSAPPLLMSVAISPTGDRLYLVDESNLRLWITDRNGAIQKSIDLAAGYEAEERHDVMLGHVDRYGEEVLMAEASAGMVRRFTLDGDDLGRIGRPGTGPCQLNRPVAAALDSNGDLLVVDQRRMVVTRWSLEENRCLSEHLGIGASPGYLYFPLDLALDPVGHLYISQGFKGKVQAYEGLSAALDVDHASPTEPN